MKIYFTPHYNQFPINFATHEEEGQEYLLVIMTAGEHLTFAKEPLILLLVPNDNSTLAQQIKETVDKDELHLFATSAENLKFKPNLRNIKGKKNYRGLLIKDTSQVERIVGSKSQPAKTEPNQITFKVVREEKEKEGQWGSYSHFLEIEPLNLGIEGLAAITKIEFQFIHASQPTPGGLRDPNKRKDLAESELYKTKTLVETVGKTFTMKVNQFWIFEENSQNRLLVGSDNYVFGSLAEKNNQDNSEDPTKKTPKDNNSDDPQPNSNPTGHETQKGTDALKTVLITGGIIAGLIFLAFIFYHFTKKKKKFCFTNFKFFFKN